MNVNDIFSQITSFWESIYPIIVFHIVFLLLYAFTFGKLNIKTRLENYTASNSFKSTKKILEEFELWKKLPFILLILSLIYLALFNSATNLISSIRVFPFNFTYSTDEFIREFEPKNDLIDIAKYGDTVNNTYSYNYYLTNRLREKYQEEYKTKYPEKYKSWISSAEDSSGLRIRYYYLFLCLVLTLLISYFRQLKIRKDGKLKMTGKIFITFLMLVPLFVVLRYQAEQKVEQQFISETVFVRTELTTDISQKTIWTEQQIERAKQQFLNESDYYREQNSKYNLFWFSRIVEQMPFLEKILGQRQLHSRPRFR